MTFSNDSLLGWKKLLREQYEIKSAGLEEIQVTNGLKRVLGFMSVNVAIS